MLVRIYIFRELIEKSKTKDVIRVPKYIELTHRDSFENVLKYMYTNELIVNNADIEKFFDFMLIAKQLELTSLSEYSSQLFIDNLTLDKVVSIYEKATENYQIGLMEACENFIDKNAEILVAKKSLIQLSNRSLEEILRRDTFGINEVKIFELVNEWHEHHNRTTDNIDNELLNAVRFELIPNKELTRLANHSKISRYKRKNVPRQKHTKYQADKKGCQLTCKWI